MALYFLSDFVAPAPTAEAVGVGKGERRNLYGVRRIHGRAHAFASRRRRPCSSKPSERLPETPPSGRRKENPAPGSPNFTSQDKWTASWAARVHYIEGSGENLRIRKEQTVEAPSFQDAERFTHWPAAEACEQSPACPTSRRQPLPYGGVGSFSLLGRVDFGEGGLQRCLRCPNTPVPPVSPDANAVPYPPPLPAKRKRRDWCCIRRGGMVRGLWKKPEKSGCTTHPGSFFAERRRVWGNGVSEQPSRRLPISQKPWEGGRGGPF